MKKLILTIFIFLFSISSVLSQSWKELDSLGMEYYYKGDYKNALFYLGKGVPQAEKEFGKKHQNYTTSLNNLASLYHNMGQYDKAELLYKEALKIKKEILGEKHPSYAISLNNLAELYREMGQYDKAEPLYKEALKIKKEILGEKHPAYATSLNNLAILYIKMGQFDKAEPLYKKALKIDKEVLGEKHPDYATDLNNMAALFRTMGQYDQAELLYMKALKIIKEVLGERHPTYASSLNNLALLYQYMEQYSKAEKLYKSALNIKKITVGENHPDYVLSLFNLAVLYLNMGRYYDAEPYCQETVNCYLKQVNLFFTWLSEKEKLQFLKSINARLETLESFLLICPSDDFLSSILNLSILTKGLILSSTAGVKKEIYKTNDSALIRLYQDLTNLKSTISKMYYLSFDERKEKGMNLDSLENYANEVEKLLSKSSEEFKSNVENRNINWKDIRKHLKEDESAIEFINFRFYGNQCLTDTIYYYAFVIRKEFEYPKLVKLCTEKELEKFFSVSAEDKSSYVVNHKTSNLFYETIFESLEQFLVGVKDIYISPSGLLNKVSFTSLRNNQDEPLFEKYNIHYKGNLKDIVLHKEKLPDEIFNSRFTSMVFGGALYDLDTTSMKEQKLKYIKDKEESEWKPRSDINITEFKKPTTIKKWNYLPGTLSEAEKITELFKSRKLGVNIYTGADASEDALKFTSQNKSPTLLHIATHGFFFPEPKIEYGKLDPQGLGRGAIIQLSDNPLFRSGLILSGANLAWKDRTKIEGMEDGILTAYEISNLDLFNTELVVLSACETGLGEIKGGEGVYGLQRAFKVAGAKTIIMSLWKVPDKQTFELMDLFYTNCMNGLKMFKAFKNAQIEMNKRYPDNPYVWAAFVMIE
jgi:CHAT domain-containing protein/tetratricopeptide (TPR) repeat protein